MGMRSPFLIVIVTLVSLARDGSPPVHRLPTYGHGSAWLTNPFHFICLILLNRRCRLELASWWIRFSLVAARCESASEPWSEPRAQGDSEFFPHPHRGVGVSAPMYLESSAEAEALNVDHRARSEPPTQRHSKCISFDTVLPQSPP